MKKFRILCLILCAVLLVPMFMDLVSAENPATSSGCYGLDAGLPYLGTAQLVENVEAAFLYEKTSDTLMYAWNPDLPVFPSSLVKIITAFVALQYGNVADKVTVSEAAIANVPYDAVSAELQVGEELTLEDLIYCMLVGSANDAAAVIAHHISGSESAFVEQMNRFAQELGCTATVLKNPHGLHDEGQVSTARDLSRILSAAIENEAFQKFFGAANYIVPATNLSQERKLSSSNFLINNEKVKIYKDERVTGGRTGIANDGTRCLASSAEASDLSLICVVLGSESVLAEDGNTEVYGSFKETTALYDMVFDAYKSVKVLYEGQAIRQVSVLNGECDVVLGSHSDVTAILPAEVKQEELSFRYSDMEQLPQAPIEEGQRLSDVEIWYGNMCIAQSELTAMNSVHSTAVSQQLPEDKNAGGGVVGVILGVIALILFLMAVIVFGMRAFAKYKVLKQTKRYRKDRRRSR